MNNNTNLVVSAAVAAGLVLSLVVAIPVLSPTAEARNNVGQAANQVEKFKISGKVAEAHWSTHDEQQEIFTDVSIYMVDSDANVNFGYPDAFVDVFISQYQIIEECEVFDGEEYCYYDYVPILGFYGFAELQESDYKISNSIRSASLDAQVSGYDYVSEDEKTINIDATWTGEGSLVRVKNSYSETNEFYSISFKAMGIGKDAIASADISGDIDISLDQEPYSDASILKFREGYMIRIIEEPY